jgi:hypothetical protein
MQRGFAGIDLVPYYPEIGGKHLIVAGFPVAFGDLLQRDDFDVEYLPHVGQLAGDVREVLALATMAAGQSRLACANDAKAASNPGSSANTRRASIAPAGTASYRPAP